MGHTHSLCGAAGWLATSAYLHLRPAAAFGGAAICGLAAVCNDIDSKRSEASRSLGYVTGIVSWGIRKSCGGHRKITHSLLGIALFAGGAALAVQAAHWPMWIAWALILGFVNHTVMDMLTKEGCPLLWPWSMVHFALLPRFLRVTTGGKTRRKRRRNQGRVHHHLRRGSEYVVVQPLAALAALGSVILLALGR
jgi:membrane-bound metal-dependent hydrolase YbcI (DUF457 family)